MAAAFRIEVADFRTALTSLGLDVTIGPAFADTDDALFLMMRISDAFRAAQQIQNDFADEGEDVQAISRTEDTSVNSRENPPGSGSFVDTKEVVYRLTGNTIISTTGVVGNFV